MSLNHLLSDLELLILVPLPLTRAFWFGWIDNYPKTEIFRAKK